jgi:multiple sugar transport system substrate-binding protein
VENPGALAKDVKLGIDTTAGKDAATVIQQVVRAGVGGPALSTAEEGQALALFEGSGSGFLVNWPYTWAQLAADKVSFRDTDIGWAQYPATVAGETSHPPFGGIEIGIGSFSKHKDLALAATKCITSEQHQTEYMVNSGNPSANTNSYTDAKVKQLFPMADLILSSLQAAAPRPQSQYYGDLSSAIQQSFSPPNTVNPAKTPGKAQSFVKDVLEGRRLL